MKKILIVEDELDLGENLEEILTVLGYSVAPVISDGNLVLDYLRYHQPDLILMDVLIEGDMDGIELAKRIREVYQIPIIFLTGYSDKMILDRISKVMYEGYLLKPFHIDTLKTCLYLTFKNQEVPKEKAKPKTLKIRDKGFMVPVPVEDITVLEADGLYTKIHTLSKPYTIRDILKDVTEKLPDETFLRIHKSFTINVNHIHAYNAKELTVGGQIIPMRRGFLKKLKGILEDRKAIPVN
ncbi:LytR/AlgR family response regulator transcription factor [Echinicola vietnamensis]|uniref:Response regulator of the LytR/AlgR family n=1 Tax=Echinicola vietnamensis (strain DSM 17526 / LMG 23754 / KMM 6221) TaxID=926556 RepID=L0G5B8_ECHVK|nr:response regulator [Echinicola vietnamensis]AGA80015.1 response regulator of the LytR/AlgR family [Echinicola vietnamensis DSM 17526]